MRVKAGKRQRWHRELQRRCGSKQLWELVSFTGRFDSELLAQALSKPDAFDNSGAPQPTASSHPWHRKALEARAALRWANHLARKRSRMGEAQMSKSEKKVLQQLDNGDLVLRVNELTVRTGDGRLRSADGESLTLSPHPTPRPNPSCLRTFVSLTSWGVQCRSSSVVSLFRAFRHRRQRGSQQHPTGTRQLQPAGHLPGHGRGVP